MKLGLDVILINGTSKTASRLFFSPTADKRTLINHVQIKIDPNLLMYLYKRYINTLKKNLKNTSGCVHTCAAEAFTIRMTDGGLSTVRAVTVNNISQSRVSLPGTNLHSEPSC